MRSCSSGTRGCQGRSLAWRGQEQDTAPADGAPPTGLASHGPVVAHISDLVLPLPRALQGKDLQKGREMRGHSQGTLRAAPAAEGQRGKQLFPDQTSPSPGFARRQPRETKKLSLESAPVSALTFFPQESHPETPVSPLHQHVTPSGQCCSRPNTPRGEGRA